MNFKKKDIMLILAGIILLALEFDITVAGAKIDIFSDVLAYIIILIGISHIAVRNNIFKKCKSTSIKGLIAAVAVQAVHCVSFGVAQANADLFMMGVMTIFFIYFTYYFTEGIALEAKMQDKSAVARNFKITWGVFGVFIFAYYIILNFISAGSIVAILVQAVLVICAIYYCYAMSAACDMLYMEGLPQRSEEALAEEKQNEKMVEK